MQYVCIVHCKCVAACCLFSISRKMSCFNVVALATTWWQKVMALVVEHFWVCCALCGLHRILEMYLRASAVQVVTVVLPLFLQSNILCKEEVRNVYHHFLFSLDKLHILTIAVNNVYNPNLG